MNLNKSVLALIVLSVATTACTRGWQPYGAHSLEHNKQVLGSQTYQDGLSALGREDFDGALLRFQSLSRSFRESPAALNGMALAYVGLGDDTKANFMFEAALEIDPLDQTATKGLIELQKRDVQVATSKLAASSASSAKEIMVDQTVERDPPLTMGAEKTINPTVVPLGGEALMSEMKPDLIVENGNGEIGLAGRYAKLLERQNIDVDAVRSAENFDFDRTLIKYQPGQRQRAQTVESALGLNAQLVESDETRSNIVVILGGDAS